MPRAYFDERMAERYDTLWANLSDPPIVDPAVSFLADLAGTGAALELGIGTGRLALPLSQRGVPVHGIELSAAMAAQLRAKPGADDVGVTLGDFAASLRLAVRAGPDGATCRNDPARALEQLDPGALHE